jgi:hypothetical protein
MSTSTTQTSTRSSGIGFLGLLTIVFVVLKALGYLNWSWWLVFSPVLFGAGLTVLVLSGLGIALLVAKRLEAREAKKRRERLEALRSSKGDVAGRDPRNPLLKSDSGK